MHAILAGGRSSQPGPPRRAQRHRLAIGCFGRVLQKLILKGSSAKVRVFRPGPAEAYQAAWETTEPAFLKIPFEQA